MPRDRLLAIYREAYQAEERDTYRARVVMTDIGDDLLRRLTLPSYTRGAGAPGSGASSAGSRAPHWLPRAAAQDLIALMQDGVLVGDVFADWPASPDGRPLSMIWDDVVAAAEA